MSHPQSRRIVLDNVPQIPDEVHVAMRNGEPSDEQAAMADSAIVEATEQIRGLVLARMAEQQGVVQEMEDDEF